MGKKKGFIEVEPGDGRFSGLVQGFNKRWLASNCEVIYLCTSSRGVERALGQAVRRFGRAFSIKGGGHCYEDFVFNPSVKAIIDVSLMDRVGVNRRYGYFLEAGGTNWGAYKELYRRYGLTLPAGSCYSVGLGGHICGGGYGLLSRLHGLTVDWLSAIELVHLRRGKPELITVSAKSRSKDKRDLYWAHLGGGGGNFGVITRYYFERLPAAPQFADITTIAIDWSEIDKPEKLGELLDAYARAARELPERFFGLLKLMHASAGQIGIVVQQVYDDADAARQAHQSVVRPFLRAMGGICRIRPLRRPLPGHPTTVPLSASRHTQSLTWYEATQTLNGSGANQRGKYKSAYMRRRFPANQVEALFHGLNPEKTKKGKKAKKTGSAFDFTQSLVQVDTYGGRINSRQPDETAVPQRDSIMKLQYQTYWQHHTHDSEAHNRRRDRAHLHWIRRLYRRVYHEYGGAPNPYKDKTGTVAGCYVNYPDVDLDELGTNFGLEMYYLDNFKRNPRNLVDVKRRWDPDDYFHHRQSIPVKA